MNEQLKALNELQQVDLAIAATNRALAALDNGAQTKAQVALAEKKLAQANEELRKTEAELRDKELSLKTIESKKQNFENKLYKGEVTNPKELSSIEKEIEMLGRSRAQLDERILELYEIVERQQAEKAQIEKIDATLKQRLSQQTAQYQAKTSELNADLARLAEARQKAIGQIDNRQLLSRYETIKSHHKDTGLAKVVDGKCGGCHVGLTAFALRKVRTPEDGEHQTCESCGRIMFSED